MKNWKPHHAATLEAFEEAGVIGKAEKCSIGSYPYDKYLVNAYNLLCKVAVFPLAVKALAYEWPEASERKRRWFEPQQAADLVDEPALAPARPIDRLERGVILRIDRSVWPVPDKLCVSTIGVARRCPQLSGHSRKIAVRSIASG